MSMRTARLAIALVGIFLPYLARIPRGRAWLAQYTDVGIEGWLVFGAFNAIAWGAILLVSRAYRRPVSLVAPAGLGFAFLAWGHNALDLDEDAQSAIGLVLLPVYALVPIAAGGALGYAIDRSLRVPR
jgi:hypothetical protein